MSFINFVCNTEKASEVKKGVWEIFLNHYFTTVAPNTNVQYEYEGKEIYLQRLATLMEEQLCSVNDTDEGFSFEFDSTEDAGFSIADQVYKTSMGYSDQGLIFLDPVFEAIVAQFPDICFEADVECSDKWVCFDLRYTYDGNELVKNGDDEDDEEYCFDEDESEDFGGSYDPYVPHFTEDLPVIYADTATLEALCQKYPRVLTEEVKETGKIDARSIFIQCTDLNYIVLWAPATEQIVAEAVAKGYPESMGAVAFMLVYKRYSDRTLTDDIEAIRAVVVQDDMTVGFAEMCTDDDLYGYLNVFYLGAIAAQRFLVENNKYDEYASITAGGTGMMITSENSEVNARIVFGPELPDYDFIPRNSPGMSEYFDCD